MVAMDMLYSIQQAVSCATQGLLIFLKAQRRFKLTLYLEEYYQIQLTKKISHNAPLRLRIFKSLSLDAGRGLSFIKGANQFFKKYPVTLNPSSKLASEL